MQVSGGRVFREENHRATGSKRESRRPAGLERKRGGGAGWGQLDGP